MCNVLTRASLYTFDFANRTFVRTPIVGGKLRKDGEVISFYDMTIPQVNEPMHLVIQVREDDIVTARWTTPVLEIS